MTETAPGQLRSVASIRVGLSVLSFPKHEEDGTYSKGYQSTSCPNADATADGLQEWRNTLQAKLEPEVQALKRPADADQSGFVSTDEATLLRNMYEFGLMVVSIFDDTEGDMDATARGFDGTVEQLRLRVAEYEEYRESLGAGAEVMQAIDAVAAAAAGEER